MINESIAGYKGSYPCPYNTMKNGRTCNEQSAYGKPGGAKPLCYPTDIPADQVKAYRAKMATTGGKQ